MTSLDTTTVLVVSAVLIAVVASLFVLGVWRRGRTDHVDRCWSLTFLAAVVTTFAYLAAETPALWWATALGNGAFVLSLGAIWAGARARDARPPLLSLVAASAALVAALALVRGPDGGPWAGGLGYLLALATWCALAAVELLARTRRRAGETAALGAVCAVAAAYYAGRAVAFAAGGPASPTFERFFATSTTTVVNVVLVVVGAFAMMALRTRETAEAAVSRYDAALGTRTMPYLASSVAERAARGRLGPTLQVVVLRLQDARELRAAFGREGREHARAHLATVVLDTLPGQALAGHDDGHPDDLVVVLPGTADGDAWLQDVERTLVEQPLRLDGDTVVLDVRHDLRHGRADGLADLVASCRTGVAGTS